MLHDPFLMKDMDKAVHRIIQALNRREKIMIFGDSDTDGTCGTVMLFEYLKQASTRVCYLIPSTNTDGYSLNEKAVQFILESNINLVITVDNGSCSLDGAKILKHHDVDVIITDHHVMGDTAPDVEALLNPQRHDCLYPFRMLSGAGVAFKLLSALDQELERQDYWNVHQQSPIPLERFG
jgi:single-stranded-DNA-specific exonuclease